MVEFREIKRLVKREKRWILREFGYFNKLKDAVNKSDEKKSKSLAKKLGRVEKRVIQSKEELFEEVKQFRELIFEEHQPKLEDTKKQIDGFTNFILGQISAGKGKIPTLLKKRIIPWKTIQKKVEICLNRGIRALVQLFETFERFIVRVELEITRKVNLLLTLKLNPSDKIVVFLVLFGRKPAGMITLNPEEHGKKYDITKQGERYLIHAKENILFDTSDIAEFIRLLNEIGLSHHHQNYFTDVYTEHNKMVKMERINFWVGKNQVRLQALLKAKGDLQTGKALGYPKTAREKLKNLKTVEYFQMLQRKYNKKNVPEELLYLVFIPKFNEDGIHQEHVLWGKTNMHLVKTIAPDLHQEFIKERKEVYFKVPVN